MTNRVILILSLWLLAMLIVSAVGLTILVLKIAVEWWEN